MIINYNGKKAEIQVNPRNGDVENGGYLEPIDHAFTRSELEEIEEMYQEEIQEIQLDYLRD